MKRKVIRGFFLAVILGPFCSPAVSGLSLEDIIGREKTAALLAGEKLVLSQFNESQPRLIPQRSSLMTHVDTIRRDLDPSVMVETLFVYEKPATAKKKPGAMRKRQGYITAFWR